MNERENKMKPAVLNVTETPALSEEELALLVHDMYNQYSEYENAEKYLRDVLQGRFDPKKLPPIAQWKAEYGKLIAERQKLNSEYHALKGEIREAETIRKYAKRIQRNIEPKQRARARDMEL